MQDLPTDLMQPVRSFWHAPNLHLTSQKKNIDQQPLVSNGSLLAISGTFNLLFKILFIFPSQYLFAIGLCQVFSFRSSIRPTLSMYPNILDSLSTSRTRPSPSQRRGFHSLWRPVPKDLYLGGNTGNASRNYNPRRRLTHRFSYWALAASLAVTRAIIVIFFSSAY